MDEEEKQKDSLEGKAKESEKEKAKKKKKRKKLFIKASPFIAIILIALIVFSCFTAVIQVAIDMLRNIGNFLKGNETAIELDDEKLDQLIAAIEATGIDLEDLELLRRNRL